MHADPPSDLQKFGQGSNFSNPSRRFGNTFTPYDMDRGHHKSEPTGLEPDDGRGAHQLAGGWSRYAAGIFSRRDNDFAGNTAEPDFSAVI